MPLGQDHTVGIERYAQHIYCSQTTHDLLLLRYPSLAGTNFYILPDDDTIYLKSAGGWSYGVHVIDANHCAGAVSLIFEGPWGSLLHTGDCRFTPSLVATIKRNLLDDLHLVYLDATFADNKQAFPTPAECLRQVSDVVLAHPASRVYISADLGSEELLHYLLSAFDSKLHFDPQRFVGRFSSAAAAALRRAELELLLPDALTADRGAALFELCGNRYLATTAAQYAAQRGAPPAVFIRLSTRFAIMQADDVMDQLTPAEQQRVIQIRAPRRAQLVNGVWYVLFSVHSSRDELLDAMEGLAPGAVIPFVGNCDRAFLSHLPCGPNPRAVEDNMAELTRKRRI